MKKALNLNESINTNKLFMSSAGRAAISRVLQNAHRVVGLGQGEVREPVTPPVSLWDTWAVQGRKVECQSTPFPGSPATNSTWTMPGIGCLSTTSLNVISAGS